MDILEKIESINQKLESYQDSYDPEEKMDIKQTIQSDIKMVRTQLVKLPADIQSQVNESLNDFEEILGY